MARLRFHFLHVSCLFQILNATPNSKISEPPSRPYDVLFGTIHVGVGKIQSSASNYRFNGVLHSMSHDDDSEIWPSIEAYELEKL